MVSPEAVSFRNGLPFCRSPGGRHAPFAAARRTTPQDDALPAVLDASRCSQDWEDLEVHNGLMDLWAAAQRPRDRWKAAAHHILQTKSAAYEVWPSLFYLIFSLPWLLC